MLLVIIYFLHIIFQNEIDVVILSKRERKNFVLFIWNKLSHNLQIYVDQMIKRVLMMLLRYFYGFKIIPNYSTLPDVQARQGVIKAFRHILSKKVVM